MTQSARIPQPGGEEGASPLTEMEQFAAAAASGLPAYLASTALCLSLAWNHVPRAGLAAWALVCLAYLGTRALLFGRYQRLPQGVRAANEDPWRQRFTALMAGQGLLQSSLIAPAIALVPEDSALLLTFMVFFSCTLVSALMPLSALSLRMYLALMLLPTFGAWTLVDLPKAAFLAVLMGAAAVLFVRLGHARLLEVRQRHDLTRRLAQSVEQLRSNNTSRTRMLMEANHDLRQPAHALSMMAERLRRITPGTDLQERISDMEQSIESLTDRLGELIEFSQLDLGEYVPRLETVNLKLLLTRLEPRFALMAARKSLQWTSTPVDACAIADPWLLRRVIDNAVSNAIRYTASGSVSIRCDVSEGQVSLCVQDTGPGMAADDVERAFLEYVRLPLSAGDEPGRGLGLAFARRAAEAMEGRLEMTSGPGQGTVVRLTLARAYGEPVAAVASAAADAAAPLAGCHLVLVENDELLRRSTQDVLAGWGATVDAVGGVPDIDRLHVPPTFILADLHLDSRENGLDAIARLRARHPGLWIPAILVTADTDPQVYQQARRQGIDVAYKPLPPSRLLKMIGEALASLRAPD